MAHLRVRVHFALAITGLLAACTRQSPISQSPSPTIPSSPAPAVAEQTPIPTVETSTPEPFLIGEIWYWNPSGVRSEFGRLPEGTYERLSVVPMTLPDGSPSPRAAFDFDFDRYGRGIAYLTNAGALRLWVSNLDLQAAISAWTDEDAWLENPTAYEDVDLHWGPGDRSIMIINGRRILVHSLSDGSNTRFEGECASLGTSASSGLALLCSGAVPGNPPGLFALTPDGSFASTLLNEWTITTGVVEWAYSPTGNQVLFATLDGDIEVLSADGGVRGLPMRYFPSSAPTLENTRELQWSVDGSLLLVLGVPTRDGPCPGTEGFDIELPCWALLSQATGQVLWLAGTDGPIPLDASLSPDAEWIVGSYMSMPDRSGRVVSLAGGRTFDIYLGLLEKVRWVE